MFSLHRPTLKMPLLNSGRKLLKKKDPELVLKCIYCP